MDTINWLMFANIAIWAGLGVYLMFIAFKHQQLVKRISRLELLNPSQNDKP
ncbi:CcmD family protein [Desulfovibrio litoralis]|uniref:CcmD family protein n=1 Tax=Desulfovibrio litoralis DSM 11393 TaxID=1121455 RepID=A0A1M7RSJ8_9BACT|nr:CcmD family protein [Desulfovibrio litoralis]SHN49194.1 CcmD family protein [Desulfovibrio litoralis DSM 11393]